MALKRCRDCKIEKNLEEFPPSKKNRDGRSSYCRPCMQVRSRASYRKRMGERGRTVAEARVVPEGRRWCPDCQTAKPLEEFPRNKNNALGRGGYCKPCHNARSHATRQRLYGGGREYHLRARYGIGQAEVDRMLEAQGHVCAVCRKTNPEHVDHDHATGKVRGMLCFNCNQALGNARDNVRVLQGLARYLAASRGATLRLVAEEYRPRTPKATPDPGSVVEVAFAQAMSA
jgi:hypothetical protein